MPFSKRSLEGYLLIDNGGAPALSHETAARSGKRVDDIGGVGVRGVFETPTSRCSHCHAQVILQPKRTRSRGYCPKCDRYVCDNCELIRVLNGGLCRPLNQVLDELQAQAFRQLSAEPAGAFGVRCDAPQKPPQPTKP